MYGSGSSKKNEAGGPNRKLPFLNVHTQLAKKGEVSSLTYIIEIPMVHSNTVAPLFFNKINLRLSCTSSSNIVTELR